MHETVAAMMALDQPFDAAGRAFCAGHRTACLAMLRAHPMRAALVGRAWRPRQGSRRGWMADCLGAVSSAPDLDLEPQLAELAQLWPDDRVRSALLEVDDRPLPADLLDDGIADEFIAVLRWVWTATIEADWPRLERPAGRRDLSDRTPCDAWLERGPSRSGWQAGVASRRVGGLVGTSPVCRGLPRHGHGHRGPRAVSRVSSFGPATRRSGVARSPLGPEPGDDPHIVGCPLSTTHLMGLTDLQAGSVSTHLRVLLDRGLVQRRRSGREVLYWRSALGETLAGAAGGARLTGR